MEARLKAKRHADWQKLNRRRHNRKMRPLTKKWDADAIKLLKKNRTLPVTVADCGETYSPHL